MIHWPSTLRWRLTLWYTFLLGAPLIALAVGGYAFFARTLYGRTDRFISDALVAFSREVGAERRVAGGTMSALRTTAQEVRFRELHIAILDSASRVIAMTPSTEPEQEGGPSDIDQWIGSALTGRDLTQSQVLTVRRADGSFRIISSSLILSGQRFVVTGTFALSDIDEMLMRMRRAFFVVIPLLIVCAAFGGYVVTARSLAPLSAMSARAAEISIANLQKRLPVGGSEELVSLARIVNELLNRLEESFAAQRRFMADASHELRTPTAILRTEAEVTLSRERRTEGEYRESFAIIGDASQRLTRIVDDLFLLARSDAGNVVSRAEPLYLEELVQTAARDMRQLAASRGIRVELSEAIEAPFTGDGDQLGRLLFNLLDNAIKHSWDNGIVQLTLLRRGAMFEINVIDGGEGIPAAAQSRIFDRFFRVDVARARKEQSPASSGAGLGLAIARRIAELHRGRLELIESRRGRTEFRLTLPAIESTG